jgi:TorA maturation chaperone TorD
MGARIKTWTDPDMGRVWKKFEKKHGYLFWIQSMNVKNEEMWQELIKGKEPNLNHEARVPSTPEEYIEIEESRREVYFQLFRGFTEPSEKLIEDVMKGDFSRRIEESCSRLFQDPRIEKGLDTISGFVQNFKSIPLRKLWDNVDREYQAIFYDGFVPWISTYESIYLSEKQTMGDCTQEVKDLYKIAGLCVALRFGNDPPDDLRMEMEFMFRMCEEELRAWKEKKKEIAIDCLKVQNEMLRMHIAEWVPYLCDDLANEEFKSNLGKKFHPDEETIKKYEEGVVEADFYRGLAFITKAVIEHDFNQVVEMLKACESLDPVLMAELCKKIKEKDISKEKFHLIKEDEITEADKPYVPPHPKF